MTTRREDGQIYLIAGATRSGKTAWMRRNLLQHERALIWDVEGEWSQLPNTYTVTSVSYLQELTQAATPGKQYHIAFVPGGNLKKQFDDFCRIAFNWGNKHDKTAVVVEELADVTPPGKAPDAWGIVLRRGCKRGMRVYGITNRPAESDKTIIAQAAHLIVFEQRRALDREYIAKELQIAVDQIPTKQLIYIHKNNLERTLKVDSITFPQEYAPPGVRRDYAGGACKRPPVVLE